MKIRGNIISGTKLVLSILKYNKYLPKIDAAKRQGDKEEEKRLIAAALGGWIDDGLRIFDLTFDIKGLENIPEEPCLFVANHQAYADVPAILKATQGRQVGFIAKKGFEGVPLMTRWILAMRGLFIPKDEPRESLKVISKGAEYLKEGFSMCIFPEGMRSFGPEMNPFKPGALKLATKAKVPVVPVTIDGTYRVFEEHMKITSGQTASVIIHPAIPTKDMNKQEQGELSDRVEAIIKSALSAYSNAASEPNAKLAAEASAEPTIEEN